MLALLFIGLIFELSQKKNPLQSPQVTYPCDLNSNLNYIDMKQLSHPHLSIEQTLRSKLYILSFITNDIYIIQECIKKKIYIHEMSVVTQTDDSDTYKIFTK